MSVHHRLDEPRKRTTAIPSQRLRDIFEKDAKPSADILQGSVTATSVWKTFERRLRICPSSMGLQGLQGKCSASLVGWNGAGKTTQLRIITGEMEADEGEVMLADGVKIVTSRRSSR